MHKLRKRQHGASDWETVGIFYNPNHAESEVSHLEARGYEIQWVDLTDQDHQD